MTTESLSTFFALLAIACIAATVATLIVVALARVLGTDSRLTELRLAIGDLGLWIAWAVAAVTTIGSLYYSLGAHYAPCELCWYQRICIYPLAVVLLIAAVRRDRGVWRYAIPPAVIGAVIAAYHAQLQAFPKQTRFCSLYNPCTIRYVWKFGFVSLPLMALAAFCSIIIMLFVSARTPEPLESAPE